MVLACLLLIATMTLVVGWETDPMRVLLGDRRNTHLYWLWFGLVLFTLKLTALTSTESEILSSVAIGYGTFTPLVSILLLVSANIILRKYYPAIEDVLNGSHRDLDDVLVLACQHLLGTQLMMFRILLWSGLKPENCIIVGKAYSTNIGVYRRLLKWGCVVSPLSRSFSREESFDDWFPKHLFEFVGDELSRRDLSQYRKIIVLDDGGFLHACVARLSLDWDKVVGIEQTSSGWHRLQRSSLPFVWHSIARHDYKLKDEAVVIGDLVGKRIQQHITRRCKYDPLILVMGLGAIGQQTARVLIEKGYRVVCTDKRTLCEDELLPVLISDAVILTHEEVIQHLSTFEVIVGATGDQVLRVEDITNLNPAVSLLSASSSDREFPASLFRQGSSGSIHADYYIGERCLVNGGFPITFYGNRHEVTPQRIQVTIAMLASILFAVTSEQSEAIPLELNTLWRKYYPSI